MTSASPRSAYFTSSSRSCRPRRSERHVIDVECRPDDVVEDAVAALAVAIEELANGFLTFDALPNCPHSRAVTQDLPGRFHERDECTAEKSHRLGGIAVQYRHQLRPAMTSQQIAIKAAGSSLSSRSKRIFLRAIGLDCAAGGP